MKAEAAEEVVPEDYDDKEEMDPDEFAQYACKYASEIDCSITGKSLLALYERIEMMEEDEVRLTKAAAVDLIEETIKSTDVKAERLKNEYAHHVIIAFAVGWCANFSPTDTNLCLLRGMRLLPMRTAG